MTPWPRKIGNYPIIMIAIVWQLIVAGCLLWDASSNFATALHMLWLVVPGNFLSVIVGAAALSAFLGFFARRKISTILCLIPQQLLLYLSAGGSLRAILLGQFADGVERHHAFILADQSLPVLLALFHSWAMTLILRYSGDRQ